MQLWCCRLIYVNIEFFNLSHSEVTALVVLTAIIGAYRGATPNSGIAFLDLNNHSYQWVQYLSTSVRSECMRRSAKFRHFLEKKMVGGAKTTPATPRLDEYIVVKTCR